MRSLLVKKTPKKTSLTFEKTKDSERTPVQVAQRKKLNGVMTAYKRWVMKPRGR